VNILVIGSAVEGLNKAMGWLCATTYVVNKLVFVEEMTSKMAYIYEKAGGQPHPVNIYNLAIVPDGEEGQPAEKMVGRAKDINDAIKELFPDGSVDVLFFAVKNSKAQKILDGVKDTRDIRSYYLNQQDHEE